MKNCFLPAEILLPDFEKIDGTGWSVVACDQFTSEPEYWEKVADTVAGQPSTLNLILPEVYLGEAERRIPEINRTMRTYLDNRVLKAYPDSMIYLERTQSDGSIRRGILGKIDLEQYDYHKGSESLVRATEGTVLERIPPRVAIRRDAPLELPHIMILIDDPEGTVIEETARKRCFMKSAYEFDLMLGGGHVSGSWIDHEEQVRLTNALEDLISPEAMEHRYGDRTLAPLLFAMGDGNHSLASAKAYYEEIKAQIGAQAAATHPARYALAEIVNLHDPSLRFEPIYRVLFRVDPEEVVRELEAYAKTLDGAAASQRTEYLYGGKTGSVVFVHPVQQLTVGTLQTFLDGYLKTHPMSELDYIHGEEAVKKLSSAPDAIGFLFPGMEKSELFRTVIYDGALPRKTFSMGHAEDKRYYLECRRIR